MNTNFLDIIKKSDTSYCLVPQIRDDKEQDYLLLNYDIKQSKFVQKVNVMRTFFTEAELESKSIENNGIDSYFYENPAEASKDSEQEDGTITQDSADKVSFELNVELDSNTLKLRNLQNEISTLEAKFKQAYSKTKDGSQDQKINLSELKKKPEIVELLKEIRLLNKKKQKLLLYFKNFGS